MNLIDLIEHVADLSICVRFVHFFNRESLQLLGRLLHNVLVPLVTDLLARGYARLLLLDDF